MGRDWVVVAVGELVAVVASRCLCPCLRRIGAIPNGFHNGTALKSEQAIDWAAASGTYVAAQLVIKTDGGRPLSVFSPTATDLQVADGSAVIDKASVTISQVGLVFVGDQQLMYVDELGPGWYPDILEPVVADAGYQLAATGKENGTNGFRFGYDTGGRTIKTVLGATLQACKDACDTEELCEGVFLEGATGAEVSAQCVLVNDTRVLVPADAAGLSLRRQRSGVGVPGKHARSIWIGVSLPTNATPGIYTGSLQVSISVPSDANDTSVPGDSFTVPIKLEVWPIDASCILQARQSFGLAFGFDHYAVNQMYPIDSQTQMQNYARFSEERQIPTNSLTGWTSNPVEAWQARVQVK